MSKSDVGANLLAVVRELKNMFCTKTIRKTQIWNMFVTFLSRWIWFRLVKEIGGDRFKCTFCFLLSLRNVWPLSTTICVTAKFVLYIQPEM